MRRLLNSLALHHFYVVLKGVLPGHFSVSLKVRVDFVSVNFLHKVLKDKQFFILGSFINHVVDCMWINVVLAERRHRPTGCSLPALALLIKTSTQRKRVTKLYFHC